MGYGVPQASLVGTLLLTQFINDVRYVCQACPSVIYADDTCILFSSNNVRELYNFTNLDIGVV